MKGIFTRNYIWFLRLSKLFSTLILRRSSKTGQKNLQNLHVISSERICFAAQRKASYKTKCSTFERQTVGVFGVNLF